MSRIPVAIVGATGLAGQQFLASLTGHPLFEIKKLAASSRSAGKKFAQAVRDDKGASKWFCSEPLAAEFADIVVEDSAAMTADGVRLCFSAVEADVAREMEPRMAAHIPVISTASAFRNEADTPVFLPGVNWDHAALIDVQRKRRGWKGFITPGPNCTTVGLAMTLKPLEDAFGVSRVIMTSMQALSGAGRSPGVSAMDILDNIIPYIPKEEEKVERETQKILGHVSGEGIVPASVVVSCTCTRVNVLEGHTESVFVELKKPARLDDVKAAWREFGADMAKLALPSAPKHLITVRDDPFRPQVRLDRDEEGGMSTVVGRLREDPALQNGIKYMLVSHNTRMGAARGAILVAEYLTKKGYIK
ncbi:MAG: aspartate-semialdehyde dehydrogenase [Myxococcales bacterium]|jgi:aspartate-semialdehyde dehydrogenase|nr:aspartate-semialdehyde dehydrogenase [Myxococcales bacterium]